MAGITKLFVQYRIIIIVATAIAALIEVLVIIWRTKHKNKKRKKKKKVPQRPALPPGPDYVQRMMEYHNRKALPSDSRIEIKLPKEKKKKARK